MKHMLATLQDARAGMSISSASVAKREKLLQRNAILRRTGFIETESSRQLSGGKGALPGPLFCMEIDHLYSFPLWTASLRERCAAAEIMDPLNRRNMAPIQESLLEPSALSAALGSPNSKQ